MTVTDTDGALGVSCWLADLTSLQPEIQITRSDKATAIEYHDRLVRLSCFIAVFPLTSPMACAFPKYSSTEFCDQFPLSSPRRKPGSSLFLDSGFRRNDVWEHPTHFGHLFVTSCTKGECQ